MAEFAAKIGLWSSWGGRFEVGYIDDDGFAKVNNVLTRCWSLNPGNEVGNIGTSFLMYYEGDALHLTSFGDKRPTTIVPSWIEGPFTIPSKRTVVPQWTIDLFFSVEDAQPFCCVQKEFPWPQRKSAFHFREGRLVGRDMDKTRVDNILERISKTIPATEQFSFSTL